VSADASRRVLVTGLSGVGKSSVLAALAERGYRVADTDYDGLSLFDDTGDWVWNIDRVRELLDGNEEIVIAGTAPNMSSLLPRFDRVILLSAPAEVMIERLATRTTNPYGSSADQRAEAVAYKQSVEPRLRRIATIEIDTRAPLDAVVARILDHLRN
jgi:dephospho-CoA kinase